MGWYCYHQRRCLNCGHEFQSEHSTLLMVNDNHKKCPQCQNKNSVKIDKVLDKPYEDFAKDINKDSINITITQQNSKVLTIESEDELLYENPEKKDNNN